MDVRGVEWNEILDGFHLNFIVLLFSESTCHTWERGFCDYAFVNTPYRTRAWHISSCVSRWTPEAVLLVHSVVKNQTFMRTNFPN